MKELPDRISLDEFKETFKEQWEAEVSANLPGLLDVFPSDTKITHFMQDEGGFLEKLMRNLDSRHQYTYKKEDCKIDAMYVGGQGRFGPGATAYPPALCAMIEHENRDYPEQEMWKLVFWRSPLKVIIFYDYSWQECQADSKKANWLPAKLDLFKNILADANRFHPEHESTQYLFLIGAWKVKYESIYWRWASNQSWQPLPLTGM